MSAPLTGLTAIAVEQAVAAPICTARLVDAGARVIKIERSTGDFARGYDDAAHGDSSYFAWANHGKESIALDIKAPDDAALLHRMISQADVFVQNLAPGALDRAGFGSTALRASNPTLVTCDISGYGEEPGLADKKAYDLLVQAESGLVSISGGPGELGRVGISLVDIGTGVTAFAAILEALIRRGSTGEGTALAISMFDVAAEWMTVPFLQHSPGGRTPTRVGLHHPSIAPYGAYQTNDGALTLFSIQNEREWVRLCADVLHQAELATDSRFASNEARVANRPELEQRLVAIISDLNKREFEQRLTTASIAWGSVNDLAALHDHPALRTRTIVTTSGDTVELPAHPVRSATDAKASSPIPPPPALPTIGQQSDAVRAEFTP